MNLEEIARLSNVSRSTVSRVVNNDPYVKAETRERVLRVITQLDYRPNAAARSLATGRTRVIGLVIPQGVFALFADPYFGILIQGIASACNARNYSVMLWLAEPEYERHNAREFLHGSLIDGVIVSSMLINDPLVDALAEQRKPFVLIGRHPSRPDFSYVDADNENGAWTATSHLLRLGRRRIATITGPQNMVAGADRRVGYVRALRERGLVAEPELEAEGDFTEAGGYLAMQRLLPHRPDAVFVASDMMAQGALRALREAGLHAPTDVAIASFDDIPISAHLDPPLTTVRQPIHRLGATAVEQLIQLIDQPSSAPQRVILSTELVIRSSCGVNLSTERRI